MDHCRPASAEELQTAFRNQAYLADRGLTMAVLLAMKLGRPLLLEGAAGVGKTEVAKVLAAILQVPLIRLQCYEGIDASQALYEWDYPRQLLHLRAVESSGGEPESVESDLYTERFLLERPLLKAIQAGAKSVLLIDEVDRADDEFEAFLLEVLADFQVSIPEVGTITAEQPPVVVLTSNRTRELHEALRRRCLYYWIDHPSVSRLAEIISMRAPEVQLDLVHRVSEVIARFRALDLFKPPTVAEAIDWARALEMMGIRELGIEQLEETLTAVIKEHDDLARVRASLPEVMGA